MLDVIIAIIIVLAVILFIACAVAPSVLGHEANQPEEEWDGTTEIEAHFDNGTDKPVSWYSKK